MTDQQASRWESATWPGGLDLAERTALIEALAQPSWALIDAELGNVSEAELTQVAGGGGGKTATVIINA
jgi:hypothetical protein